MQGAANAMGNFFKSLGTSANGFVEGMRVGDQPREYSIAGRTVRCPHCGEMKFIPQRALWNNRARPLFTMEWSEASATILVCAECGRIESFAQTPDVDLSQVPELD